MADKHVITKVLSANDTGETGGHQAGILIPKDIKILSFFPTLDKTLKNPRMTLTFVDINESEKWKFEFIYYNNKFFDGTRNEYRLTGMTAFMRSNNLKAADSLIFSKDEDGNRSIVVRRKSSPSMHSGALKLGKTWKVIYI